MFTRMLIALLFSLGMVAGVGFAAEDPADPPEEPVEQPVEQPVEPVEPDEEDAEVPHQVFPAEDVLGTLTLNEQLVDFHGALLAANVHLMFEPDQEYTVFAPHRDVFAAEAHAAHRTQDSLVHYIVVGAYTFAELWEMAEAAGGVTSLQTLGGQELTLQILGGELMIEGATIQTPDIDAANGVVHVVDALITPTAEIEVPAGG